MNQVKQKGDVHFSRSFLIALLNSGSASLDPPCSKCSYIVSSLFYLLSKPRLAQCFDVAIQFGLIFMRNRPGIRFDRELGVYS